jgi:hypothetical protein
LSIEGKQNENEREKGEEESSRVQAMGSQKETPSLSDFNKLKNRRLIGAVI